jgi:RNA polymerase sigma-70 factor, ECF subfamily
MLYSGYHQNVIRGVGAGGTSAAAPDLGAYDRLADLLHRVQGGDEVAFGDLYDLTQERVAQVVVRTVVAPQHSAEVVQEVYLYVWQHARSFDQTRGSVLGWLTMLAHRRAVDRVRSVVRSTRRDHRNALDEGLLVADAADLGMARHEAAQLRGAVRLLSLPQRDALVLTFWQGYTHQQAAVILSVPVGTLKSRIRDAVKKLRRQLGASPVLLRPVAGAVAWIDPSSGSGASTP